MGKIRDETVEQLARRAKEEADRGSVASAAAATYFEEREPPATRNTTSIEWTHQEGYIGCTWNPTRGCSRVSPGCGGGTAGSLKGGCYAEQIAGRFSGPGQTFEGYAEKTAAGYRWTGKLGLIPHKLVEPLSWRKPRRVFVNSMSDLFHESLAFEEIAAVVGVIAACPESIFMTLTKRAARMREWFEWIESRKPGVLLRGGPSRCLDYALLKAQVMDGRNPKAADRIEQAEAPWPLHNLQIGISAEDQKRWDERVPELLRCPAAVRFVSAEPLLASIDMGGEIFGNRRSPGDQPALHQIIIGGESGPGARPCHVEWIRDLLGQCRAAGVKPFWKQGGSHLIGDDGERIHLKDKKGGNLPEIPVEESMKVREQV